MSRACLLSVLLLGALAPVSAETVCLFYGSDEGATANVAEYIGIKTGLQVRNVTPYPTLAHPHPTLTPP